MTEPQLPALVGDCANCDALCCMALAFDAGSRFAYDKPAATACRNLRPDNRCAIHDTRQDAGFSGCLSYDCLGAGQVIKREVLPDLDWRDGGATQRRVMEAFRALREVHRLVDLLRLANALPLSDAQRASRVDLLRDLLPPEGWAEADLVTFEQGPLPVRVQDYLKSLRDVARPASP